MCQESGVKCKHSINFTSLTCREFYHVLFTGVRVMIEGGSIVEQYFGPWGFRYMAMFCHLLYSNKQPMSFLSTTRWLGVIIYITFLFMVIVVLLNLLIAQMSDTYANVQMDAQRSLAIQRAWIVARVEHNTLLHIVST